MVVPPSTIRANIPGLDSRSDTMSTKTLKVALLQETDHGSSEANLDNGDTSPPILAPCIARR